MKNRITFLLSLLLILSIVVVTPGFGFAATSEPLPITFSLNYPGSVADQVLSVDPGQSLGSSMPANPTRQSFSFTGWNTAADGSGDAFTAESAVDQSMTLYAQWTRNVINTPFSIEWMLFSTERSPLEAVELTLYNLTDNVSEVFQLNKDNLKRIYTQTNPAGTIHYPIYEYTIPMKEGCFYAYPGDDATQAMIRATTGEPFYSIASSIAGPGFANRIIVHDTMNYLVQVNWVHSLPQVSSLTLDMTRLAGQPNPSDDKQWGFPYEPGFYQEIDSQNTIMDLELILAWYGELGTFDYLRFPYGYRYYGNHTYDVNATALDGYSIEKTGDQLNGFVFTYTKESDITLSFQRDEIGEDVETIPWYSGYPMQEGSMPEDPVREGYLFEGWNTELDGTGDSFGVDSVAEESISLYAQWSVIQHTVTFDSSGGEEIAPQEVDHGATATEPENPVRIGFYLDGWFTEEELTTFYDFNTPVTSDITLYAGWTPIEYLVDFDSTGGSPITSQTVPFDGVAEKPADPTRKGYLFEGWFSEPEIINAYDFTHIVTQDRTLYAKWKAIAEPTPTEPTPAEPTVTDPAAPVQSTIVISYQTKDGKDLFPADRYQGNVGDRYRFFAREIKGHKLIGPNEMDLTYKAGETLHGIFYYQAVPVLPKTGSDPTTIYALWGSLSLFGAATLLKKRK